jgi:hypothetical protein
MNASWRIPVVLAACLAACLAALAAGALAGEPPSSGQSPGPGAEPAYYRDNRLWTKVTLDGQVLTGEKVLEKIHQQAKVRLLMEEDWLRVPVGIAAKEVPAAQMMDALQRLYRGRWELVEPYWVLARSRVAAERWAQRAEQRMGKQRDPGEYQNMTGLMLQDLVLSLTPAQWTRLEREEKLGVQDLSPPQWAKLRQMMLLYVRDPRAPNADTPRPLAFTGEKVYVWLNQRDMADPAGGLYVGWPSVIPEDDGLWEAGIGLTWQDGKRVPGLPDGKPARAARPQGAGAPSRSASAPAPGDYHQEPLLGGKLSLEGQPLTWGTLLGALEKQGQAPFLAQGEWLQKPVPFQVQDRSAAEVMEGMAKLEKGKWDRAGPAWVLIHALVAPQTSESSRSER